MAHLAICALLTGLFAYAYGFMEFINPPPFGMTGDLSNSPRYGEGTTVNVAWTLGEEGRGVSLCLYQLSDNDGMWFGDMEYLTQNALQITRYSWLVGTRKNLTISNLFYLSIFQEGKGSADSNSHYFYIEKNGVEETATTPATTSSSSPSPPVMSSTSTPETTSTVAPTSTLTSSSTQSVGASTELLIFPTSDATGAQFLPNKQSSLHSVPLAVKYGLGIGMPCALILGLVAGWLLFRYRRKRDTALPHIPHETSADHAPRYKYYHNNSGGHYGSRMHEAPPKSPVEMGQSYAQGSNGWVREPPIKSAATPTPVPVRYEM